MRSVLFVILLWGVSLGFLEGSEPDSGLRFLEKRAGEDPDDFVAQNQLLERYLSKLRSTGRLEWLPKARKAAQASLHSVAANQNPGGLLGSARVALAEHRFAEAAKLAAEFCASRSKSAAGYEALFDAQLELGEYEEAAHTLDQLAALGDDEIGANVRRAQFARIHGMDASAPLEAALSAARALDGKQPDLLVWCLTQRGELAFNTGDFPNAEKCYVEALTVIPDDWRAASHLAELRAAEGKFDEALVLLGKCIESTGRPELLQAAGDLEAARGNAEAASGWLDRALAAYRASIDRGEALFVHHLAGFYCDSRPMPAEAVRLARQDLASRESIQAHAALAWALHLDGKLDEAAAEATLALATGTKDAHLLYQAGLIFTGAGDLKRGRAALRAAEEANPRRASFHFHR